jgi:hypothetical protein
MDVPDPSEYDNPTPPMPVFPEITNVIFVGVAV